MWQYRTGQGSGLGGQWGAAADGQQAYFGVNGPAQTPGGMRAVRIDTGEEVWSKSRRREAVRHGARLQRGAGRGGDGDSRRRVLGSRWTAAFAPIRPTTASIVWQFDTNREFETVNGVKANGGAMDGPGASSRTAWCTSTPATSV